MGICLYDGVEFPWADSYFKHQPVEPLGHLGWMSVDSHLSIEPTLEELVIAINNQQGWKRYGEHIMFVTHGSPKGLFLTMNSRDGKSLREKDLDVLNRMVDSGDAKDVEAAAKHFNDDKQMMDLLRKDIESARRLCTSVLAIRACRIGHNTSYLTKLARLLNIKAISAPMCRDFFGVDRNPKVSKFGLYTFDDLVKKTAKVSKPIGNAPDRVLMTFTPQADHKFSVATAAESEKAVTQFFAENFCFKKKITKWKPQDGMVVYGVTNGGKYLFPAFAGYQSLFVNMINPHFVAYPPTEMVPLPMVNGEVTITAREDRRMRRAALMNRMRRRF